jgi:glucose/arabinose dehydrogenase
MARMPERLLPLFFCAAGVAFTADTPPLPPPANRQVQFVRDVEPILRQHCYGCHGDESEANGYSLWERRAAVRGGHSGIAAIVPGNSAESRLIHLVSGREKDLLMPPAGPKLSNAEIGILRAWIDQGVRWAPSREGVEDTPATPWLEMDYGPFLSASISVKQPSDPRADKQSGDNITYKGIAISLTPDKKAAVLFDTELLRYSAGWVGGYLALTGTVFDWKHGPHPYVAGAPVFENPVGPGLARDGSFRDPRSEAFGNLPESWGRYRGAYVHGEKLILSYTAGGASVLELPGFVKRGDLELFTRTIEIEAAAKEIVLQVAEAPGESIEHFSQPLPVARAKGNSGLAAAVRADSDVKWDVSEPGQLRLRIPPARRVRLLTIILSRVRPDGVSHFAALAAKLPAPEPLAGLTRGGPARYTQTVRTSGKLGAGAGPYVVDELTLPFDNPYKSWFRPGDFAFFDDDRAAVTTWSGDVWIVSGINRDLKNLTWRRFATGLHQPMGVEIVDGVVYVLGRDQITRLHDLNNDGEADFYENFNNDFLLTHHFHEFTFDLDRDREGNFLFAKAARHALPANTKHHGAILKLDKNGKNLEIVCTGFRVPNGVAVGPNGEIVTSDQEGHWIPSTRINWCSPGSFHGYMWGGSIPQDRKDYDNPVTFLPVTVDNSGAGQAFVESDRWGPFRGHLIHSSFGRGKVFLVLMERVDGQIQGGAVELPLNFSTGLMRPEFRKQDGQLYLCGLYGWGTKRKATGGLYRVRYTGGPVYLPDELHVTKEGVSITFTQPLEKASAENVKNYYSRRWNYKWTSQYGSDLYQRNGARGTENVKIRAARLSADGRTVVLEMEDMAEVMQMQTGFKIKAADGTPVSYEIFHTVNVLRSGKGRAVLAEFK